MEEKLIKFALKIAMFPMKIVMIVKQLGKMGTIIVITVTMVKNPILIAAITEL